MKKEKSNIFSVSHGDEKESEFDTDALLNPRSPDLSDEDDSEGDMDLIEKGQTNTKSPIIAESALKALPYFEIGYSSNTKNPNSPKSFNTISSYSVGEIGGGYIAAANSDPSSLLHPTITGTYFKWVIQQRSIFWMQKALQGRVDRQN